MPFPCPEGHTEELHPVVVTLVEDLTALGRLNSLYDAVKNAVNEPDPISELAEWKIENGDDFLQFASCLLKTWTPSENATSTFIYEVITVFYYIFDRDELIDLQTPISPSSIGTNGLPVITKISGWISDYAKAMGTWLKTPASITPDTYKTFWEAKEFRMEDYLIPDSSSPVGGFASFNEMFCRFLKDPSVRPISSLNDPDVVVFPADSTFDGAWTVDSGDKVTIKSLEWPISALLVGCDPETIQRFEGGTWCHAFLNTFDYHRQHAPVAGTVVDAFVIDGLAYLDVVKATTKDGKTVVKPRRPFQAKFPDSVPRDGVGAETNAPDYAGYEFIQKRGCVIIDTGTENGYVAVLPIGMAQVSSVELAVKQHDVVTKGQEISHFEFGGSDIVLVFEKGANPAMFARVGQHHLMGETLCHLNWNGHQ